MTADEQDHSDPALLAQLLMVEVTGRLEDLAAASVDLQTSNVSAVALSVGLKTILVLIDAREALLSGAPRSVAIPEKLPL